MFTFKVLGDLFPEILERPKSHIFFSSTHHGRDTLETL